MMWEQRRGDKEVVSKHSWGCGCTALGPGWLLRTDLEEKQCGLTLTGAGGSVGSHLHSKALAGTCWGGQSSFPLCSQTRPALASPLPTWDRFPFCGVWLSSPSPAPALRICPVCVEVKHGCICKHLRLLPPCFSLAHINIHFMLS